LKGQVREEPVVAERNAQTGRDEEGEEHRHLEPIDSEGPKIPGDHGDGREGCSDQK
jgi:hypothetical protein